MTILMRLLWLIKFPLNVLLIDKGNENLVFTQNCVY